MSRSSTSNSEPARPAPYRFFLRVLLWFLPLWLPAAYFELSLWRAGETTPIGSVCAALDRHPGALFARQFFDQGLYRFKWVSIQRRQPEIVALGNSRVLQFRREMFGARSGDFFNAGGMIQGVRDLEQFVAALPADSALTCAIIGVDYAWFNERAAAIAERLRVFEKAVRADDGLDGFAHGHVFQDVLRNGWTDDADAPSWSVLAGAWRGGDAAAANAWGFLARNRHMGFRVDGSYDYGLPAPADWTFQDREHPPVLERIRAGVRGFEPAAGLAEARVTRFLACLRTLKARGVTVLCFAPPYPSGAVAALEERPGQTERWRQYREVLPPRLREEGAVFVDAANPAALGLDDRCMRDGLHAMETFHVRLLAALAAQPGAGSAGLDVACLQPMLDDPRSNLWFPRYPAAP